MCRTSNGTCEPALTSICPCKTWAAPKYVYANGCYCISIACSRFNKTFMIFRVHKKCHTGKLHSIKSGYLRKCTREQSDSSSDQCSHKQHCWQAVMFTFQVILIISEASSAATCHTNFVTDVTVTSNYVVLPS